MTLDELNIESTYNAEDQQLLTYKIAVDKAAYSNPQEANSYFTSIAKAVGDDIVAQGGSRLELEVSQEDAQLLQGPAEILAYTAEKQKLRQDFDPDETTTERKIVAGGSAALFGLPTLYYSYVPICEMASNAADKVREMGAGMAPLTGLIEAGLTVGGNVLATGVAVCVGTIGGLLATERGTYNATPLASNANSYSLVSSKINEKLQQ